MSDKLNFLITLSNGVYLLRVAVQCYGDYFIGNEYDRWQEPEYNIQYLGLVPLHCQDFGTIVNVEDIFDISILPKKIITFELVEEPVKPEVYAVGDWVVVDSDYCNQKSKSCHPIFRKYFNFLKTKIPVQIDCVHITTKITKKNTIHSYSYDIHHIAAPHYAVQRVNPPKPN